MKTVMISEPQVSTRITSKRDDGDYRLSVGATVSIQRSGLDRVLLWRSADNGRLVSPYLLSFHK